MDFQVLGCYSILKARAERPRTGNFMQGDLMQHNFKQGHFKQYEETATNA
jgi:hypothetical protein